MYKKYPHKTTFYTRFILINFWIQYIEFNISTKKQAIKRIFKRIFDYLKHSAYSLCFLKTLAKIKSISKMLFLEKSIIISKRENLNYMWLILLLPLAVPFCFPFCTAWYEESFPLKFFNSCFLAFCVPLMFPCKVLEISSLAAVPSLYVSEQFCIPFTRCSISSCVLGTSIQRLILLQYFYYANFFIWIYRYTNYCSYEHFLMVLLEVARHDDPAHTS